MSISKDLEKNTQLLKDIFKDCSDIVFRNFHIGKDGEVALLFVYVDGLIDKAVLSESVLGSLSDEKDIEMPIGENLKSQDRKRVGVGKDDRLRRTKEEVMM